MLFIRDLHVKTGCKLAKPRGFRTKKPGERVHTGSIGAGENTRIVRELNVSPGA